MTSYDKIFLTGAAGMIGSNIACKLVNNGETVIGIDNLWRGQMRNLHQIENSDNFQFRHADIISDNDWYHDMTSESLIIHTADIVAGIGYVFQNEWSIFQKNNLINTAIARISVQQKPAHLIYLGTACSYPQSLQRSTEGSVLSEKDKYPADPESGYGWSKLLGDIEFNLALKNTKTRLTILDLHNVYGWPCIYNHPTSQVIPALINRSLNSMDKTITIWGNGEQGRAFLHVNDVVSAIEKAMAYKGDISNFMLGPDKCTKIKEVVETIMSHEKVLVEKILYDLEKPVGDIGRYADSTQAKDALGWQPEVTFKDGIFSLIDDVISDKERNDRLSF